MTPALLRALRARLGWSQKRLGVALRLSGPTPDRVVRSWEADEKAISGPVSVALEFIARDNGIDLELLKGEMAK